MYLVTDCDFNKANYPGLIGMVFIDAPSYATVEPISVRYHTYQNDGKVTSITHNELVDMNRKDQCLVARADESGCEGCYVEVARWNFDKSRWERFANHKFLNGDLGDENARTLAELFAQEINGDNQYASLIYRLPSWGDEE